MKGMLTLDDLRKAVQAGEIDTVVVAQVDMQGRLMGKRFQAEYFCDEAWSETHSCNYLLATDMEMETVPGYKATSWAKGYGDYVMKPDLATLRRTPWLPGTALVLCDVLDHHTHQEVPHSPKAVLKRQVERLAGLGYEARMATELEFFLFRESYDALRDAGYRGLTPISPYNEDYHILQTTKEEHVMRPIRNHLWDAGIPVENTKGEAETGQEELNIKYAPAMETAEYHSIAKNAVKEIAWQHGHAATFLPKWHHEKVGSSSHVHQSLWSEGRPIFFDEKDPLGMSDVMKSYMAGLLKYAADYTCFMAPYINSYKRFMKGTFAPTRIIWSVDNRTAGFRLCGDGTKAVGVECRIPGSDMNPYLAMAGMLAAGIAGIKEGLDLQPPTKGDVYQGETAMIPGNLRAARDALHGSAMLRAAMGDDVVDHYTRAAEVEIEEFERVVTDWEIARGFERA